MDEIPESDVDLETIRAALRTVNGEGGNPIRAILTLTNAVGERTAERLLLWSKSERRYRSIGDVSDERLGIVVQRATTSESWPTEVPPLPEQSPPRPKPPAMAQPLVYGEIDNGLVFIPRKRAHELVLLHEVLQTAGTWGEARRMVEDSLWTEIRDQRDPYDIARSPGADEEPLEPQKLAGYANGSWPSWPAQDMRALLPWELVQRYGVVTSSLMDGDFLHLASSCEEELVTDLEACGFECERDDALVQTASGYDA